MSGVSLGSQVSQVGSVVVGVDGGGSKTACVILESVSKTVIGQSKTGSANQNNVGKTQADSNVIQSIQLALKNANQQIQQVRCVCLCLAGVDSLIIAEQSKLRIQQQLHDLGLDLNCELLMYNDSVAALSCGTLGLLRGIVLIGGTGTIAYGRREGKEVRASGWGPAFLDEGSGYDLGQQALNAAARSFDGRGPSTKLTSSISNFFSVDQDDFLSIIDYIYRDLSWARISELAPLVIQCASEGDEIAQNIVKRGINGLVNSILTVSKKLDWMNSLETVSVVFAGGLLEGDTLYSKQLQQMLQQEFPNCEVLYPKVSCAEGAALLALNHCQLSNGVHKEQQ